MMEFHKGQDKEISAQQMKDIYMLYFIADNKGAYISFTTLHNIFLPGVYMLLKNTCRRIV